MKTIVDPHNPGGRVSVGDSVILSAKELDGAQRKAVAKALGVFAARHKVFLAAEKAVHAAESAFQAQQAVSGSADHQLDLAIETIAGKLVSGGAKRTSPFAGLLTQTPSDFHEASRADKQKYAKLLIANIRRKKTATKETLKACSDAEKAAAASLKADKGLPPLTKARHAAIVTRDAGGLLWERAFVGLRHKAQTAEDDGVQGVFAGLFELGHTHEERAPKKGKEGGAKKGKKGGKPATPPATAATPPASATATATTSTPPKS